MSQLKSVPEIRIQKVNDAQVNPKGKFVLYWMIANRRGVWNYSLDRAVDWARELNKPLVVLEALRSGYPWASDRLHRLVLDGMAVNADHFKNRSATYYPYVEMGPDAGKGLLMALAKEACVIITDDFPVFFLPRMVSVVSTKLGVLLEKIDSNGLLPMRAVDRVFPTAYAFRRFLQKELPAYLTEKPKADPLKRVTLKPLSSLTGEVLKHWPRATGKILKVDATVLNTLPIDHRVGVAPFAGGSLAAKRALKAFLNKRLPRYGEDRNQPEQEATSGLSPYLHFGHISAHEVFHKVAGKEEWSLAHLSSKTNGARSGWWGMGDPAEAFLDQLVTWRELGFNMSWQEKDHERYESLPHWARTTLERHARDKRPYLYTAGQFERAQTHDPLWNAAQTQLLKEGRVHNYLRMLWGKKILHWSSSPRKALKIMIDLNNKYALDGRDPNSYSGIFWILGRYDRAWGPERSVFGKVRYMSSANTQRKLHVKEYLKRWI